MLAVLQQPRRVLEIGTFTGYATLCLAEGLAPEGKIDTIEGNKEAAHLARQHFALSPYQDRINLHVGQATEVLLQRALDRSYDLIFLDADKRNYPNYLPVLMDRLAPGGLLIADNVLWDGKAGTKTQDVEAKALHRYNKLVTEDERLNCVVLPIRDGLSVARRRR